MGAKLTNMEKLEHIGIAVKNIDQSNTLFASILGVPHYKIEEVESEGVRTSFFDIGGVKIELLEALHNESPIARHIEKRGEGVHHLAFSVDDISESIQSYKKKGFEVINETPKRGADAKMICFLRAKSTGGVLIELCQDINTPSSSH